MEEGGGGGVERMRMRYDVEGWGKSREIEGNWRGSDREAGRKLRKGVRYGKTDCVYTRYLEELALSSFCRIERG